MSGPRFENSAGEADRESLSRLYQGGHERNRLVASRGRSLEFWTTMRMLEPIVSPRSDILETGSGSGRYAVAFARAGHRVTATDIVPEHVAQIVSFAAEEGVGGLRVELCDATDLGLWPDRSFDLVLCLGPWYHLRTSAERGACLSESRRVLREGGILALAYINRTFAIAYYIKNGIFFDAGLYGELRRPDYRFRSGLDAFLDASFLSSPDEVATDLTGNGFTLIDHAGTDGLAPMISARFAEMTDSQWEAYREYHWSVCREPGAMSASSHGLAVCRKLGT